MAFATGLLADFRSVPLAFFLAAPIDRIRVDGYRVVKSGSTGDGRKRDGRRAGMLRTAARSPSLFLSVSVRRPSKMVGLRRACPTLLFRGPMFVMARGPTYNDALKCPINPVRWEGFAVLHCKRVAAAVVLGLCGFAQAGPPKPTLEPLLRVVDLRLGQSQEVQLADGKRATVRLLDLRETRDPLRDAVREAQVLVEVDGRQAWLTSANYELPRTVAGVQIDCPITKGYLSNCNPEAWGLAADARLRLWPAGSPLVRPGTFVYPIKQRWFASATQMANEPCYVDARRAAAKSARSTITTAWTSAAARAWSRWWRRPTAWWSRPARSGCPATTTRRPSRATTWSTCSTRGAGTTATATCTASTSAIRPGVTVQAGQPLGLLGKEGGSGGWSHLHFDIFCRQPSGKWGCQEAYAFVWEAYRRQYRPQADRRGPARTTWPAAATGSRSTAAARGAPAGADRPLRLDLHRRQPGRGRAGRAGLRPARLLQRDPQGHRRGGPQRLRFRHRPRARPPAARAVPAHDPRDLRPDLRPAAGRRGDVQGPHVRHHRRRRDLGLRRRQPGGHTPARTATWTCWPRTATRWSRTATGGPAITSSAPSEPTATAIGPWPACRFGWKTSRPPIPCPPGPGR